jgi:hypothetical protein
LRKKFVISSFSFPRDKEEIIDQAEEIASRERISFSSLVMNLIENYVKVHGSGNPSFELNKWIEEPEFRSDPAVAETNEKWDRYLSECDEKDLSRLQGTFKTREEQAKNAYLKKKGFRK